MARGSSESNEREIFLHALALSAEDQATYLDRVCAGDAALRQRVESSHRQLLEAAGVLHVEHPQEGLRFYNVEPGFVLTEAMRLNDPDGEISKRIQGAPPEVPAAVVACMSKLTFARAKLTVSEAESTVPVAPVWSCKIDVPRL